MTREQVFAALFNEKTRFAERVCTSPDDFEAHFARGMTAHAFVADLDDEAEEKMGFVVIDSEGINWYTILRETYEAFLIHEITGSRNSFPHNSTATPVVG